MSDWYERARCFLCMVLFPDNVQTRLGHLFWKLTRACWFKSDFPIRANQAVITCQINVTADRIREGLDAFIF